MQHASPNKELCAGICYNLTHVRHSTRRTGPSDKQQAVTGQSAARKHLPAPACHRQRPLHVLAAAANADKAPCAGFSGNMQDTPPNPQLSMPSAQAALTRSPTTTAGSAASWHLAPWCERPYWRCKSFRPVRAHPSQSNALWWRPPAAAAGQGRAPAAAQRPPRVQSRARPQAAMPARLAAACCPEAPDCCCLLRLHPLLLLLLLAGCRPPL
jgi:hypothetical protein